MLSDDQIKQVMEKNIDFASIGIPEIFNAIKEALSLVYREKQKHKMEIIVSAIDAVCSCERLPGPRVRLYEAIGAIHALSNGGKKDE